MSGAYRAVYSVFGWLVACITMLTRADAICVDGYRLLNTFKLGFTPESGTVDAA